MASGTGNGHTPASASQPPHSTTSSSSPASTTPLPSTDQLPHAQSQPDSSIITSTPADPSPSSSGGTASAANPTTVSSASSTPAPSNPSSNAASQAASSSSASSAPFTASFLPRSVASTSISAASSSASTSGSTTPVNRTNNQPPGYSFSPRRIASNLASTSSNNAHSSARRIYQHQSSTSASNSLASAMTSTDGTNVVPSMFGFYSHDGNASASPPAPRTSQPSSSANYWRATGISHSQSSSSLPTSRFVPSSASNSALDTLRSLNNVYASSAASPRNNSNGFGASPARQSAHLPSSSSGSTLSYQQLQAHIAHLTNTDPSLMPSAVTAQPTFEETTTISFTWIVRDLHLLREEVELTPPPSEGGRSVSAGAGKSEVWTSQPIFGDGKWRLELIRTPRVLSSPPIHSAIGDESLQLPNQPTASSQPLSASSSSDHPNDPSPENQQASRSPSSITVLSVYLTAMVLDYSHADVEIPASIMIAIRPAREPVGTRGSSHGGWTWRRFYDYTFRREAEFFACHDLPSVSEMLQDPGILRDDAFALTIQLGLGPGNNDNTSGLELNSIRTPFEVDGHHLVPRSMITSLQGLLDDSNTGDVRIVVRERGLLLPSLSDTSDNETTSQSRPEQIVPFPIGSSITVHPDDDSEDPWRSNPEHVFVRDRFLWAHSSVLKSRSDYFRTMLASEFSEGIGQTFSGDRGGSAAGRNVRTLRIPDADFVTAYWFLRYLYTEEIQFSDKEDVRGAVLDEEWARGADHGHLTANPSAEDGSCRELMIRWTPISQLTDYDELTRDHGAQGHGFSLGAPTSSSSLGHRREISASFASSHYGANTTNTSRSMRARSGGASVPNTPSKAVNPGTSVNPSSPSSPSAPIAHHHHDEGGRAGSHSHLQHHPHAARLNADPHEHPTADPGPASALSIFKLAHRYQMEDLSRLASLHLVASLTPQSAFPLLLATSVYTGLHTRIKTYVYQHWHLVSHTQEFERCCDEVSVGMWGADAGKTLRAFVRSLVSPIRA